MTSGRNAAGDDQQPLSRAEQLIAERNLRLAVVPQGELQFELSTNS
jgi:hypothetical protein